MHSVGAYLDLAVNQRWGLFKICEKNNRAEWNAHILVEQLHTEAEKYSHFEMELKDSGVVKEFPVII